MSFPVPLPYPLRMRKSPVEWILRGLYSVVLYLLLPITVALFCALMYAFLMLYPCRKMPSYERACKLANLAGLNERGWAALNVLYGRDPMDRPGNPPGPDVLTLRIRLLLKSAIYILPLPSKAMSLGFIAAPVAGPPSPE